MRLAVAGSEGDGFIRNSVDDRTFAEEDYVGAPDIGASRAHRTARDRARRHSAWKMTARAASCGFHEKDLLVDPSDIWLTTVTLDNPDPSTMNEVLTAELSYEFDATPR